MALRPMPHVESAAIGFWVRAGGRYESPAVSGVSHFLEHLLFKGTTSRSCEAIKQAVEGVGGTLNGFTAEEFTCYMAKVPAKHLRRAVAVLADMLLHPAFRPRDIEKEREVILEEIRMVEDSPAQYVHELFGQLLWPNHPLGNLLSGTADTVTRISRRAIVDYWRRFYQPRNVVAACAGAFDETELRRQLQRLFRRRAGGRPQRFRAAPRLLPGPRVRLLHKATEQTHLCLGTPAVPRTHPQRFALELLHVLLGANMSSRLFHEVREKRGLVYEIGTHVRRYHDTGAFVIYAGCDAAKLRTTVETIVGELRRIKREPIRPHELRRAKDFYEGQLLMGLEDTMEHMLWVGEQGATVGRASEARHVIEGLGKVTTEQVRTAAGRLFTSRRTFLAVVGPVAEQEMQALRSLCVP
ncbi:MAG: insulinase family protein [Candidatus Omnitrophica bacterium]|nr:insulinase family protein [Candidatus Omnitrophota bacterium]